MTSQYGDLSDYFKAGLTFQDLYKLNNFGNALLPTNRTQRANQLARHRRETRGDALLKRRNISASKLSPYVTPCKNKDTEKVPKLDEKTQMAMEERRARLQQWRQMKLAQKQLEKEKKRPPFIVGSASAVNKPMRNQQSNVSKRPESHVSATNKKIVKTDNAPPNEASSSRTHRYATRSRKGAVELKELVAPKNVKQKKAEVKEEPKQRRPTATNEVQKKLPSPKVTPVKSNRPVLAVITPENKSPPVYVSPFVTVSRGKDSARKEYQQRFLNTYTKQEDLEKDVAANTSPKAGAAYFRYILNDNIDRIQEMCKKWETYKIEESPPEEACDMINVAIGQSQLLITKKFEQFRSLIDKCEDSNADAPVTCEDLHGFWDMVYIQVGNLQKRFENLEQLKGNNWVEIIPEKKVIVKTKPTKKKSTKANSNLRDIIKAARELKKKQDGNEIISPARETTRTPRKSTRSRPSIAATKCLNSSPGLQMLRASMNIKLMSEGKTPARSILKSEGCCSEKKKTVLFQNTERDSDIENDNVFVDTVPDVTPVRRSRRLSSRSLK